MAVPADPPATPPTSYVAQTDNLLATVKWLTASAGAIAAALVAGLQLSTLSDLSPVHAVIGTLGALLALLGVGAALKAAGQVLATERPSVTEVSNQEINAGLLDTGSDPAPALDEYPLVRWVQERRTSLLGAHRSATALYSDGVVGAGKALQGLRRGEVQEWEGRMLDPQDEHDVSWVSEAYAAALGRVATLEEAAAYWQIRKEYEALLRRRWFLWLFVVGVLTFVLVPVWGRSTDKPQVSAPIPVTVYVDDSKSANLPAMCPSPLIGQAVSGSLEAPVVVIPPRGKCPALKLDIAEGGLIAIPSSQAKQ